MKKYAKDNSIRGAKTDRLDSVMIAHYGIHFVLIIIFSSIYVF